MKALTSILLALAHRLMPRHRREWLQAMRAESAHLSAAAAMAWAFGALITAISQRFVPMIIGNFRVSRWVILVETLSAFGILTLGWFEVTFGASGLIHHTPAIIEKFYLTYPGGGFIVSMWLSGAVVGLIGPIGLVLGLRYALLGQPPRNRRLMVSMIVLLLLYSVGGSIVGLFMGPPGYIQSADVYVLVALPVAVLLHLMQLARPSPGAPLPA